MTIQGAIDSALPNQIVQVREPQSGDYPESISMRPGVAVEAYSGDRPVVRSGSTTTVTFPSGTDSRSVLRGFRLEGGTEATVRFGGTGTIADCQLYATYADTTQYLGTTVGIDVQGGDSVVVADSDVHLSGAPTTRSRLVGVRTPYIPGADVEVRIQGCLIEGSAGTGVDLEWNDVMESSTIVGTDLGADLGLGATLRRVLLADNANLSVLASVDYPAYLVSCVAEGAISGANADSVTVDLVDPLLCGEGEYTLRADSPASPDNNPWGELVCRYPVTCLWGEIQPTLAKCSVDGVVVTGDVTIPEGRELRLLPGSRLVAASGDNQHGGADTSKVELVVEGRLTAAGTVGEPVLFEGPTATPGSWHGIVLSGAGVAEVDLAHASIKHAAYGIRDESGYAPKVTLEDSGIYLSQTAGVYLRPQAGDSEAGVSFLNVLISNPATGGAPYGVYLEMLGGASNTWPVSLVNLNIQGKNAPGSGLILKNLGAASNPPVLVDSVVVEGLPSGTGVLVEEGVVDIPVWSVVNCKVGVELRGSATTGAVTGVNPQAEFTKCATAVKVGGDALASVSDLEIEKGSGTTAQIGVHTTDYSATTMRGLTLTGIPTGVKSFSTGTGSAVDTLRTSSITEFSTVGVSANLPDCIDMGTDGDWGNNSVHAETTSPPKYVSTKYPGSGYLMAERNWWGTATPPAAKFGANVDYVPYLTQAPLLSRRIGIEPVRAAPVPFRVVGSPLAAGSRATIHFQVAGGDGPVRLVVFDVQGRIVKTLASGPLEAGEYEVVWDGSTDTRTRVGAGVFFIRLDEAGETHRAKIVRLP